MTSGFIVSGPSSIVNLAHVRRIDMEHDGSIKIYFTTAAPALTIEGGAEWLEAIGLPPLKATPIKEGNNYKV